MVNEYLKVGDKIEVLCTKIDHVQGSIKLSRKQLLKKPQYLADHQSEKHIIQSIDGTESNHIEHQNDNLLHLTKCGDNELRGHKETSDANLNARQPEENSKQSIDDTEYDQFEYQEDGLLHYDRGESNEISKANPQSDDIKQDALNDVGDLEYKIESNLAAKYTNVSFDKRCEKFACTIKYAVDGERKNRQHYGFGYYNLAADAARARDLFYQKLGVSPHNDNFNFASESHYNEARAQESTERGVNASYEEIQDYIALKVNTAIEKVENARAQSAVPDINGNADNV